MHKKAGPFLTMSSIIVSKSNKDYLFILFSCDLESGLFFKVTSLGSLAFDKWFKDFIGIGIPLFSSKCNSDRLTTIEYYLIAVLADLAFAVTRFRRRFHLPSKATTRTR